MNANINIHFLKLNFSADSCSWTYDFDVYMNQLLLPKLYKENMMSFIRPFLKKHMIIATIWQFFSIQLQRKPYHDFFKIVI